MTMRLPTTASRATLVIFLFIFIISIKFLHQSQNSPSKMSNPDDHHIQSPINPYQRLHITPNPDGTITRLTNFFPTVPPSTTSSSSPSLSKDVPLNPDNNTRIRIFFPHQSLNGSDPPTKLPILVFVHGGGFILLSQASPVFHDFCSNAAGQLGALVVSVDYRLAPEHRLPAPYDDVLEALNWVKDSKDEWVREYGDLSNCVLMGESAGGNIAYHATLRASDHIDNLKPLIIKGLVLIQPYFSGSVWTGSELRLVNDPFLPLVVNDLMWSLALSVGANRSHEYCDPTVGGGSSLDRVREVGWRVGIAGCSGDPLYDRNVELVKLLERRSIAVRSMFSEGGHHGMFVSDPTKEKELFDFVMEFIS